MYVMKIAENQSLVYACSYYLFVIMIIFFKNMRFIVLYSFSSGDHYQLYSAETPVNGKKPRFLNDLTIAEDGTIYMTDSSVKWDRRHNRHQIMEGEVSGRSALTNHQLTR